MSYDDPRITLNDSMMEIMIKMSGGNPGALRVLLQIVEQSPKIDPQGAMEGLGPLLGLDTENIYEERIWGLYKDVCGQDLVKMLACLRASQLGLITSSQLSEAVDGTTKLDVYDVLLKVKKRLKQFNN